MVYFGALCSFMRYSMPYGFVRMAIGVFVLILFLCNFVAFLTIHSSNRFALPFLAVIEDTSGLVCKVQARNFLSALFLGPFTVY